MGHFSMEIYAPTGSNLNGNKQIDDAEVVADAITEGVSVFRDIRSEERHRLFPELAECGLAGIMRDIVVHDAP